MKDFIKRNKEELIVCLVFIFFALGFNIYRVQSDGLIYYRFLEKMLSIPKPESPPAALADVYFFQSGCAFFNAPFYLIGYIIKNILKLHRDFNGITLGQISINLASNFYIMLSLLMAVKILKILDFRHRIFPVLSILFSTSAFAAGVVIPSFNHAADIFITTFFVYLFLHNVNEKPSKSAWLGILTAIAISVRYSNLLLLILPVIYFYWNRKYKHSAFALLGFFGAIWIIPLMLYTYNGTVLPFYHTNITAETARSMGILHLIPKYMLKLLVHPLHGVFIWSPVTVLSALGLVYMPEGKQKEGYLFLGTWFLFLVFLGYLYFWSAGWSFSNRYLVNLFPIYVIGLSAFLERAGRKTALPVTIAVICTFYSIFLFLNWYLCIMHGEYGTPADMINAWVKGQSSTSMDKIVNLKVFSDRVFEMCRYKYFLKILK